MVVKLLNSLDCEISQIKVETEIASEAVEIFLETKPIINIGDKILIEAE